MEKKPKSELEELKLLIYHAAIAIYEIDPSADDTIRQIILSAQKVIKWMPHAS
jgi:hypothetical protein